MAGERPRPQAPAQVGALLELLVASCCCWVGDVCPVFLPPRQVADPLHLHRDHTAEEAPPMSANRIFRYPLPITDSVRIDMPAGAEPISVGPPRNGAEDLDMWAIVDPNSPAAPRTFLVVGTGNPIPDGCARFVGTVVTHGGALVWHVFEALT